jgi:transcriptional regulator with XRE-family HTH domain
MRALDTFFGNLSIAFSEADSLHYGAMDIRDIVAVNIQTLMDYARDHSQPHGDQKSLAKKARVAMSTIARIRKAEVGCSVDVLDAIARVYGLSAWQLLMPNLDPTNPPVFCMTATERDMYRRMKQAASALAELPNGDE